MSLVNWAFDGSRLGITMKGAPHIRPDVDSEHRTLSTLLGKDAVSSASVGMRVGYVH